MSLATDYGKAIAANPAPADFRCGISGKGSYLRAWVNHDGRLCLIQEGMNPPEDAVALAAWLMKTYGEPTPVAVEGV